MARKKNEQSDAPKKPGRFAQVKKVFTAARKVDPLIPWWMLLAFVAVLVVAVGIGFLVGHPWYAGFVGLPLALLAATLVLSRRAERAAYTALEGQAGASGAALGSLRRGWYFTQEPVAADATRPTDVANAAMVFRAVGRPGVVLIAEGPQARARRLVESERKKLARIAPGVPVSVLHAGDGEGQVPVRKLSKKITRMKPVLTKQEAAAVNKRLKALGGAKPPIPKGMDPLRARVDRKAMRGR
jgi:hypothetical protein